MGARTKAVWGHLWGCAGVIVALVAVSGGGCKKTAPDDPNATAATSGAPAPAAPANAVRVLVAYGSEKKTWLEEEVRAFLATSPRVGDRPIAVETKVMGSGEAVQAILRGELKPHVLSPASSAYNTLLNDAWTQQPGHAQAIAPAGDPLLLSPIVIALWKPMAEALGWPGKRLGWKDLLAVARDPQGWGRHGHAEWGAFKLGHTHPEYSNSGLLAVLAAAYAGAGSTRGLTTAQLDGKPVTSFVNAVEKSIVHYGKSTGFFADSMEARGPAYLSAAVLYENLIVESYGKPSSAGIPLVAVYPREGTFWCDHPFSILDAPWVGADERKAAQALLAFLRARPAQERALELGFRPADPAIPVAAPIDAAHGADAKQPQTLLALPDAPVLQKLLALWRAQKRPTDVELLFDKSGSMDGRPLAEAKKGARTFLERLHPEDQVTLRFFDNNVYPPVGPVKLGDGKADLLARVDGVFAGGGTSLYEAVAAAYDDLSQRAAKDPTRIRGVVLMTDGRDESSKGVTLPDLVTRVRGEGDGAKGAERRVRVFAIAYGAEASDDVLKTIASAGEGTSARGTVEDIVQVYDDMAAFF
jgi:Ca-activated chloride channel family protein